MRDAILSNIDNAAELEKLYRSDKALFSRCFNELYPDLKGAALAEFWKARLNFGKGNVAADSGQDLVFAIIGSLVAWLIAKLPAFFGWNEELFYSRNIGFIIFPVLAAYFSWKNRLPATRIAVIAGAMLLGLVFINKLPNARSSDTIILSCIHLVLFLWSLLGLAFVGDAKNNEGRLGYLKYNGDLVVMTTLIGIAFGLMTGITLGLFSMIGFRINETYMEWVGVLGAASAPVIGTYLIRTNPQLVGRVSPVIAKIFSPVVLVMLTIYLGAMFFAKQSPFTNRDFLITFNALLIGVMAIIFFSVSESSGSRTRLQVWILFLLSTLTIIVNSVALSAIIFRISEWGLTPNRAAVLGGNVLILLNLLLVSAKLYMVIRDKAEAGTVGLVIARYLPVYVAWTAVVTFGFPFIFGI